MASRPGRECRVSNNKKPLFSPTARRGRGKDKTLRSRKSKVQLQCEKLARHKDETIKRACSEEDAVPLPAVTKGPRAPLPAKARPQSNNNSAPARTPTPSLTSSRNLPRMHPDILPDEHRTAEMQELQETMPGREWVRTDNVHLLQQLLDEKRAWVARQEGIPKQHTVKRNQRRKRGKRRQARQGAAKVIAIKTESIDGSPETGRDSAYGSATHPASGSCSRPPQPRTVAGRRADSIIDIVTLCTYPGQTIEPSSFNHLFVLQKRIDAAVNDQGPLRNILRNLPRDIILTVERKEAIWVAQGKLNRITDERRRGRRLQKLDRYLPSDRRIPTDRYIPGVPYDPIPHMLAMMVLSTPVA
ncbi:hypothetical protein G6011_06487 [Alternaria panax]|uniref:Uncharacterized protein n=1 Tax=Alternaria panax TaxID=48097 RepID=A0AAD4FLF7_9PLEO|nr:hypothetical protein G6011_06487 [Alternaria panax]